MYSVGKICVIAAVAVVGDGLFGFDISSISAIISTEAYVYYINQVPQHLDTGDQWSGPRANVQGGITAAMPDGSWFGASIFGYLSDYLERKKIIQFGSLIWYASFNISTSTDRVIGLSAPLWSPLRSQLACQFPAASLRGFLLVSVMHKFHSRQGRLVGAQQWAITWRILIMFYVSYGSSFINGTAAFGVLWSLQMLPAIFLLGAIIFLPESPTWLDRQDRWEES